jgi:hypothetical protein
MVYKAFRRTLSAGVPSDSTRIGILLDAVPCDGVINLAAFMPARESFFNLLPTVPLPAPALALQDA